VVCHDPAMAFPSQTPGYRRLQKKKEIQLVLIGASLSLSLTIGIALIVWGVADAAPSLVWLGVAIMFPGVLLVPIAVTRAIKHITGNKKDRALREPGTVELLTVASSYFGVAEESPYWELTSEMQIRLDSGHTFRGSYYATIASSQLRRTQGNTAADAVALRYPRLFGDIGPPGDTVPHFDEWFCVGASLRCMYNPTNPDKVLVFPQAVQADEVTYNDRNSSGPDHVWFYSAT
jgi:hypothetical protein